MTKGSYYMISFLSEEAPRVGRHRKSINDVHITYLYRLNIHDSRMDNFVTQVESLASRSSPIPITTIEKDPHFGEKNVICVDTLDGHTWLNLELMKTAYKSGVTLDDDVYWFRPHISQLASLREGRVDAVKHFSLVRSDFRADEFIVLKNFFLNG